MVILRLVWSTTTRTCFAKFCFRKSMDSSGRERLPTRLTVDIYDDGSAQRSSPTAQGKPSGVSNRENSFDVFNLFRTKLDSELYYLRKFIGEK